MNYKDLIAIDIHTHAEVSCWNPFDNSRRSELLEPF